MKDLESKAFEEAAKTGREVKVTILEGEAPEQSNPEPVIINGTISAPSRFIKKRTDTYNKDKSHCKVSETEGEIRLYIDEQNHFGYYHITGKVELGKRFLELGINTDKTYEPTELANRFRLMRSIFKNHSDHARINKNLRNLKARINGQMEDLDDRKGNRSILYKQTVESNIPDSFILNLPLIEGEEPEEIEVAVILEVNQGAIHCYLESVEGQDRIDELRKSLVKEEVAKIEDHTTVIYY